MKNHHAEVYSNRPLVHVQLQAIFHLYQINKIPFHITNINNIYSHSLSLCVINIASETFWIQNTRTYWYPQKYLTIFYFIEWKQKFYEIKYKREFSLFTSFLLHPQKAFWFHFNPDMVKRPLYVCSVPTNNIYQWKRRTKKTEEKKT